MSFVVAFVNNTLIFDVHVIFSQLSKYTYRERISWHVVDREAECLFKISSEFMQMFLDNFYNNCRRLLSKSQQKQSEPAIFFAWRACVLTSLRARVLASCPCVLTCFAYPHAQVLAFLACLLVLCLYVLTYFICWLFSNTLRVYVLGILV